MVSTVGSKADSMDSSHRMDRDSKEDMVDHQTDKVVMVGSTAVRHKEDTRDSREDIRGIRVVIRDIRA